MATWQVDFQIAPRDALANLAQLDAAVVRETEWWRGRPTPRDYRARLGEAAPAGRSWSPDLETWGAEDGNRIDVWSEEGTVVNIVARVDVRRLDARFGAALLLFVRSVGAVLLRTDGLVVEPTIGAFGAALRGSSAWSFANDPATWLAARPAEEIDD